jgi:hypothetical protein
MVFKRLTMAGTENRRERQKLYVLSRAGSPAVLNRMLGYFPASGPVAFNRLAFRHLISPLESGRHLQVESSGLD